MKLTELIRRQSKYLDDVFWLIKDLDFTTFAQTFLYFGPKHIQADFLVLMAMSKKLSSELNINLGLLKNSRKYP